MDDIEAIFQEQLDAKTDSRNVSEATDQTIPTGTYKLEVTGKELQTASEESRYPGRLMAHVAADVYYRTDLGEFVKRGKQFFNASPVEMRSAKGNLDVPHKLWCMLVKLASKDATNRDVYESIGAFPLRAYITRTFIMPDGGFQQAKGKTQDEREKQEREFRANGGEARNFVQNLSAWSD